MLKWLFRSKKNKIHQGIVVENRNLMIRVLTLGEQKYCTGRDRNGCTAAK